MKVSIGVPTYNGAERLDYLLQSIKHFDEGILFYLVVLDDGTPPDGARRIKGVCSRHGVRLIEHDENMGIAKSWNDLTKYYESDITVLINDDVIVAKDWLKSMAFFLENNVCGSVSLPFYFIEPQDASHVLRGEDVTPRDPLTKQPAPHKRTEIREDMTCGVLMCPAGNVFAFKREMYDLVGGFDERFKSFFEESDFGTKLAEKGFKSYGLTYPMCYDDKTEVLTNSGWVRFNRLTRVHEVATLNPITGELIYQKPSELMKYNHVGDMVEVDASSVNLLVTPDHMMYVKRPRENGFSFKRALSLIKTKHGYDRRQLRVAFKKDALWIGRNEEFFELPRVTKKLGVKSSARFAEMEAMRRENISWKTIAEKLGYKSETVVETAYRFMKKTREKIQVPRKIPMTLWLEFLGYWLSEGSATLRKDKAQYIIHISQSEKNQDVRGDIIRVLDAMGYKPELSKNGARVYDKELYAYLSPLGKSDTKYIPVEFKGLSPRLLKVLLMTLFRGDGTFKDGKFARYYTKSKVLADDVQELLVKVGLAGDVLTYRNKGFSKNIMYSVGVKHKTLRPSFHSLRISLCKYNGYVYCVSVPEHHIIYVRRNGKAVWCGNCWHVWSQTFRENPELEAGKVMWASHQAYIEKWQVPKEYWAMPFDYTNPKYMSKIPRQRITWLGKDGRIYSGWDS